MLPQKKLKVCLVSISLSRGGAERSCAMLSQMLVALGHQVNLVVLNNEVDYPFGGELFNLGKFKDEKDTPLKRLLRFRKLREYLIRNQFDVIIDHRSKNILKRELFYARFLYRGFKRIYVVHSSKTNQYLTEKPTAFSKICNANIFNVAVSNYIENEILHKQGIENTVTIHNAYNPTWGENRNDLPKILQNKRYILSYGRLDDSIKDFSFLIESFSASGIWKKDFYLVILGDGNDKEMLQKLATSKPCSDKVLFLPFTNNPFGIIKNARCVTLTSKYEGFPMVLVEALSLGTPVISLDIVSGPSEIVEHNKNGLLIAERSLPLFSEALHKMCFDDVLYNSLKMNSKSSVEKFSMQNISKKWNQILQNAIR